MGGVPPESQAPVFVLPAQPLKREEILQVREMESKTQGNLCPEYDSVGSPAGYFRSPFLSSEALLP